jgi:ribosomal protein S18 acetylase RimI-like enzyme
MEIAQLSELPDNFLVNWGHNGYSSNYTFTINSSPGLRNIVFNLELTALEIPFVKHWTTKEADIIYYNQIINEGHSYAALEGDDFVGIIICQERKWNNTLYIEHLMIAEGERGKGAGSLLMKKIIKYSSGKNYRLIELETQNTNVPAIKFYEKQGFKITGLNLILYDPNENPGEFAIFMSYNIRD